jgi:hypothetical protein
MENKRMRFFQSHSRRAQLRSHGRGKSRGKRPKPFGRLLRVEPLEDRRLLAVFTVTNLDDEFVSEFVQAPGTLRQAIFDANEIPGDNDTINFQPGLIGTILLDNGELWIRGNVELNGPGAGLLTIDASGNDPTPDVGNGSRVLRLGGDVLTSITVAINDVTLTGGDTAGDGGGISNDAGSTLTVSDSVITGNAADDGGGVYNGQFAALTINRSTISYNNAFDDGGGISNGPSLTITVSDSTISGNIAHGWGGGVFNAAALNSQYAFTIANSTVSGNHADGVGGGGFNFAGVLAIKYSTITDNEALTALIGGIGSWGDTNTTSTEVYSSIISGNSGNDVVHYTGIAGPSNTFLSQGYNLIGTGNSTSSPNAFNQPGDSTGVTNPEIGPLADNGGPTQTHALLTGSPAIDAGNLNPGGGVPSFDQRGTPHERIFDGDDDSLAVIDIGAFEKDTIEFIVDTLDDEDDGDFSAGDFSLREAIGQAELVVSGLPIVKFASSLTSGGPAAILLSLGQLEINNRMQIQGPGAELLTIDAQGNSRIFGVDDFENITLVEVMISGLTLTGGNDLGGGGAVFSQEDLTIADCTVTGNTAEWGGGLYNADYGDMTVLRSILSGNSATSSGGGIYNWIGEIAVHDSTISENTAPDAAGIQNANQSYLLLANCTVTGNIAENSSGGLRNDNATAVISYTTFSDNEAPQGAGISNGANADLNIDHSTISGNTAETVGGGIFNAVGTAVLSDSDVSYNSAAEGGGIANSFGGQLTIIRSTISGNTADTVGGGLRNDDSTAEISDSTISGNSAPDGGGIVNFAAGGQLTVIRSTISGNMATGGFSTFNSGGGILNRGGTVTVDSSTFNGNTANYGGGLYVETPLATTTIVSNSTFSANDAVLGGGGIYNYAGHVVIEFSTVTLNNSNDFAGSGVVSWGDSATTLTEIHSSIIAYNHHTDAAAQGPPENTFSSLGYNVIGVFGFGGTFTQPGDQVIDDADPLLGLLADNGGPTQTHALLPGSPAIDAGDPDMVAGENEVPEFDQRGPAYTRVFDAYDIGGERIDIGAFELDTIIPAPEFVGDYNHNDLVDAADYTVWRNNVGQIVAKFHGADGNGDGIIDRDDYLVWKAHYGEVPQGAGSATSAAQAPASTAAPSVSQPAAPAVNAALSAFADAAAVPIETAPPLTAPAAAEVDVSPEAAAPVVAAVRSLPPAVDGQSVGGRTLRATQSTNDLDGNSAAAAQDQALLAWLAAALRADGSRAVSLDRPADLTAESPSDAAPQTTSLDVVWPRLR